MRDIEDAFKDETGRLLLSKTAVSQLGERLWEDYRAFTQRDLSEYEITYLFVDGIAERLRPGAKREPVLAAWGFTIEGRRVLLHMMAGSKEDAETVTAFFEDMKRRGLNDPLLVTSDGAPGIIKAIEICFPSTARQRCLAHRMRNLAAKVCFMDDFEAGIAHLGFPVTHRRAIRTTNLLETPVCRGTPSSQDHRERVRRESRLEADVRCADPSRRAMALDQGHRVRTSANHFREKRTRSGI